MEALTEAEQHLQVSLSLAQTNQIAYIEMYSQLLLGQMRHRQGFLEEALSFLQAALAVAIKTSIRQDEAGLP